jgi:class 3 adenylate cyclase
MAAGGHHSCRSPATLPAFAYRMPAWVEKADGTRIEIAANCRFGRGPGNTIVLGSPSTSRRHAEIHSQTSETGAEYWIVDLGSTNGTVRNGRRLIIPCILADGDVLSFGDERFVFRTDHQKAPSETAAVVGTATVRVLAPDLCWLLMVDIKRYTSLTCRLEAGSLSLTVGRWFRQCRDAIETNGGSVDKLLGDGIFAYWRHSPEAPARVNRALLDLGQLQRARDPDFRIVVHLGDVLIEGGIGGANNISGSEVIYVFRMEKVCSRLQVDSIVSDKAREELSSMWHFAPLGRHRLGGFPGAHPMFRLIGTV